MGRSILAILSGVVTIGVLAVGSDSLMRRISPSAFDANGFTLDVTVLLVMAVYTVVFSAAGGWVTAVLARRRDLRDVLILAGLQFVMTLAANVMLWDPRLLWYYGLGLVTSTAAIAAGGWMRIRSVTTPTASPVS